VQGQRQWQNNHTKTSHHQQVSKLSRSVNTICRQK
jgi:hypothetical protein